MRVCTTLSLFLWLGGEQTHSFSVSPSLIHHHHHALSVPSTVTTRRSDDRSTTAAPQKTTSLSMVSYDDLLEKLPSKEVLEAVKASRSENVIASDIAATAGVSLSQARKDLTTLASLSQGDIAVSSDGELMYAFPSNLNAVLSKNSAKFRADQLVQKVWPKLFYGIRVGFGVALLVSIFAIFSTIALISSGSSSDDDRRDDRRRGGGGFGGMGGFGGGFLGPSPFDFFYYRPYYGYYGGGQQTSYKDPEEMGFLESTFSYIFGDGNPNARMEEQQLQLVTDMIRQNGGAVTAEQLVPFVLDDVPKPEFEDGGNNSNVVDESYVLPIVTKLNGEPIVTEDGDIVYLFPEIMQTSSSSSSNNGALLKAGLPQDASAGAIKAALISRGVDKRLFVRGMEKTQLLEILDQAMYLFVDEDEDSYMYNNNNDNSNIDVLQEREVTFSVASSLNKVLAGALGAVNLGGALYLGNILNSAAMYGVRLPSYYGLVQSGFPLLLGYAILYNVIPLARNLYVQKENAQIKQRNQRRRQWRTQVLASSTMSLTRKLKRAKTMGMKMKQLGSSSVLYDTRQSAQDITVKRESDSMRDFDRLLEQQDFE